MAKATDISALGNSENPISEETIGAVFDGRMLTENFLAEEILPLSTAAESEHRLDEAWVLQAYDKIKGLVENLSDDTTERDTERTAIFPILEILGWQDLSQEYNLPHSTRLSYKLDALLFMDGEAKKADQGIAILENKRPNVTLDRGHEGAAMQIMGYLRHVAITKKIVWGILTNGNEWRLYYQNASSVSEQFFSVRLNVLFGLKNEEERLACFKIFLLMFAKQAFKPVGLEQKSFHLYALEGGKLHQQRITEDMADKIFREVYETLVQAIADKAKDATNEEIKVATLKFLFRILFLMFAEDRELLPVNDNKNYLAHSLRQVRIESSKSVTESENVFTYWGVIKDLFRIINNGDKDFEVPKYNGKLFKNDDAPLLNEISLSNKILVKIIRPLSHFGEDYINYKNFRVEELGTIYEQLLERDVIKSADKSEIFISGYARRKTGSYYTPQELVNLVIKEAIDPLYEKHIKAFEDKILELIDDENQSDNEKGLALAKLDPAQIILSQKICDPSMGSGHFLVSLTDHLTDQAISAMGQAEDLTPEEWQYQSPLRNEIEEIRQTIHANAKKGNYQVGDKHLQDRHIIMRMVLKKCIYGVDKNIMAVELAKLSLWLHTFTVGAPLSFLDHHLKCGDSLFGLRLEDAREKTEKIGTLLSWTIINERISEASEKMEEIGELTDAEIEQVQQSETLHDSIEDELEPIKKLFSFLHACDWLNKQTTIKDKEGKKINLPTIFMDRQLGDPIEVLSNPDIISETAEYRTEMLELIKEAAELDKEENFFHWQIEFPEVWQYQLEGTKGMLAKGGFDAIIGNPPWDQTRLEEIEWFADRDLSIASAETTAKRKEKIDQLKNENDKLYKDYEKVSSRINTSQDVLKSSGIYEDLNTGDMNIYKIFLERSRQMVSDAGFISLVIPSSIASGKQSAKFFIKLVKARQLISFYDFENGRVRYNRTRPSKEKLPPFFKDVDTRSKFCIFTTAKFANQENINYGCFLQQIKDIDDPEKCFPMNAEDFELVNPNTGTIPLFRREIDRRLVVSAYKNHPIIENFNDSSRQSQWKVYQYRMLDSSLDSQLFKTEDEIKKSGAYPLENNRYKDKNGIWLPLYKGENFELHDHRAKITVINPKNIKRPLQSIETTPEQHKDSNYLLKPFYWVLENERTNELQQEWVIGFGVATASTNERTLKTTILPNAAYQDSMTLLLNKNKDKKEYLLYANLSTIPFDYIGRQKIYGTRFAWFILQQLPVIDVPIYEQHRFGDKTAAEVIKKVILELVYTAHDLKAFAEDLGDTDGPYEWNPHRRLSLMAKLDAIYFILYGITDDDDISYIYSTFKITKEKQEKEFAGSYKSLKLCIDYKNALLDGNTDIVYPVI